MFAIDQYSKKIFAANFNNMIDVSIACVILKCALDFVEYEFVALLGTEQMPCVSIGTNPRRTNV